MKGRFVLDINNTIVRVESDNSGRRLTCKGVKKQASKLITISKKEGDLLVTFIDYCVPDMFVEYSSVQAC